MRVLGSEGELAELYPDPLPCGRGLEVKQQSRIHYGMPRTAVETRLARAMSETLATTMKTDR